VRARFLAGLGVPADCVCVRCVYVWAVQEVASVVADTKAAQETRALATFLRTLQADVGKATYGLRVRSR